MLRVSLLILAVSLFSEFLSAFLLVFWRFLCFQVVVVVVVFAVVAAVAVACVVPWSKLLCVTCIVCCIFVFVCPSAVRLPGSLFVRLIWGEVVV